jgi:predicted RNase H-like nuclease
MEPWLAGVDGCAAGWIVVLIRPATGEARIIPHPLRQFSDVLALAEPPAIVAVDIPIGLPARSGRGGRDADNAVRSMLGARQSSVFSIPSRRAVYAEVGPFTDTRARYAAHRQACAVARATSDPPRGIAIQAFGIFEKIRELDTLLRGDPSLVCRIFETHPEVAFWRLNGKRSLDEPKKVKNRPFEPGLAVRRRLLAAAGIPPELVEAAPPRGAGPDDVIDALACAITARRLHEGRAYSFPDPPGRDEFGLPIAIWA